LTWFAIVFAVLSGAANPVQSAAHGQLSKQLQQWAWSGLVVYIVGMLGMLAVLAVVRQPLPVQQAHQVSWWAWTGGLISIFSTIAALLLVQKLGSGIFTSLSVTSALVMSVLLDQFGLLGMKQHPVSVGRLIGCGLLIVGVWLVGRS
jgi:bacterial/archaeal transporter family-2 protein